MSETDIPIPLWNILNISNFTINEMANVGYNFMSSLELLNYPMLIQKNKCVQLTMSTQSNFST